MGLAWVAPVTDRPGRRLMYKVSSLNIYIWSLITPSLVLWGDSPRGQCILDTVLYLWYCILNLIVYCIYIFGVFGVHVFLGLLYFGLNTLYR